VPEALEILQGFDGLPNNSRLPNPPPSLRLSLSPILLLLWLLALSLGLCAPLHHLSSASEDQPSLGEGYPDILGIIKPLDKRPLADGKDTATVREGRPVRKRRGRGTAAVGSVSGTVKGRPSHSWTQETHMCLGCGKAKLSSRVLDSRPTLRLCNRCRFVRWQNNKKNVNEAAGKGWSPSSPRSEAKRLKLITLIFQKAPPSPLASLSSRMSEVLVEKVTELSSAEIRILNLTSPLCVSCNASFTSISLASSHAEKKHVRRFECGHCLRRFLCLWDLKTHINRHSSILPYMCGYCNEAFRFRHQRKVHRARVHKVGPSYECQVCNETMLTRRDYLRHKVSHSSDSFGYRCYCGKVTDPL